MYDYEGKCSHNAHNSHSSQKRLVRRRSTIKVTSSGMTHLCRKTKKRRLQLRYSINALDFNKKMTTIKKKLGRATYKTVTLESEISVEGRENEKIYIDTFLTSEKDVNEEVFLLLRQSVSKDGL